MNFVHKKLIGILVLALAALCGAATLPAELAWINQIRGLKPVQLGTTHNVSYAVVGDPKQAYAAVRDRLKAEGWAVTDNKPRQMVRDGQVWAEIHSELRARKDGHTVEISLATVKGRPDWPAPVLQVGLADWNMPY